MGVLADLVTQAQPALVGGGCTAKATAGATWLWQFYDINDTAGDPIDLSAVTGTCEVVDSDENVVTTLDFDGDNDGTFTIGLDEGDTVALAPGKYRWRFSLDDATDVVQFWGGQASKFVIEEA